MREKCAHVVINIFSTSFPSEPDLYVRVHFCWPQNVIPGTCLHKCTACMCVCKRSWLSTESAPCPVAGLNVFTSLLLLFVWEFARLSQDICSLRPRLASRPIGALLTPFKWAADVLRLVDGGRAQKVKTQAWEFSETSPPPQWLSWANICFQSQFLQREPPPSTFQGPPLENCSWDSPNGLRACTDSNADSHPYMRFKRFYRKRIWINVTLGLEWFKYRLCSIQYGGNMVNTVGKKTSWREIGKFICKCLHGLLNDSTVWALQWINDRATLRRYPIENYYRTKNQENRTNQLFVLFSHKNIWKNKTR